MKQALLPDAEVPEDDVEQILHIHPAGKPTKGIRRPTQPLRTQFERPIVSQRLGQGAPAILQSHPMPCPRDEAAIAGIHPFAGELGQSGR